MAHHINRVHLTTLRLCDGVHHGVGHFIVGRRPKVDNLVVLLTAGDQTVLVLTFEVLNLILRFTNQIPLGVWNDHVILTKRDTGRCCVLEAQTHDAVSKDN